ncbi:hypothetical protein AX14_008326, partial [Amanita brunnescens Koide BX004]
MSESNLNEFLVEHAKFPFPQPDEYQSADATDISRLQVGLLEKEWKANHAVRDDTLVQKLCSALENILGDTRLVADAENQLLARFSSRIQFSARGREDLDWRENSSEIKLLQGVLEALADCLWEYGGYDFLAGEVPVGRSESDYIVIQVKGEDSALVEPKSPSVMKKVGGLLPPRGIAVNLWCQKYLQ